MYIDFENIAISLTEQGYTVNLDHLIDRFVIQAKAHGQVTKMAAYAPWGQRGSLPPLVDSTGREVADEAPSRLMLANIDPVFNLPGKNSADMRIAKDVITDAGHTDAADVYIMASGDRDFNQVLNSLRSRSKQVIVWGVRGSTSRQLENNPGVSIEYIEDFTNLKTHQSLSTSSVLYEEEDITAFTPSQWTSVIVQMDRVSARRGTDVIASEDLVAQLLDVGAVVSQARGEDLVLQAMSLGIMRAIPGTSNIILDSAHPIVEKTRLIVSRTVLRVQRTLQVRGWEYVNYGFLLKGLAMDRELDRPGCNLSDQWRSDWIDCLVREQILQRELIPHRHNPDDLVPVIKMNPEAEISVLDDYEQPEQEERDWGGIPLTHLDQMELETANMARRVIAVSSSSPASGGLRGVPWAACTSG